MRLEIIEIDGSLLFHYKGRSDQKPIVLMGHQDVVPVSGEWVKPPFSGEIADGKVYGRGSVDTKCSCMAFFQAVEELLAEGYVPDQDVWLSTSCTEEICAYVEKTGVTNCTLTGGEPLLQDRGDMLRLITLLIDRCGCRVEIETNGAVDLTPFTLDLLHRPVFTMDYKLPSSGCERGMRLTNMALLGREDTVKFVAGSREDLERAREIMEEYHLTDRCHVYYSPIFGAIEPAAIVEYMREKNMNKVRLHMVSRH